MFVFIFSTIKISRNKYGTEASNQIYNLKFHLRYSTCVYKTYLVLCFPFVFRSNCYRCSVFQKSGTTDFQMEIYHRFLRYELLRNHYVSITNAEIHLII